ncbi:MAG TPA: glycosyltransferase family 2 protein, partial [Arcobacter sp.]|nr:glycosyltransferase family 2 protein [Arcobacter sp.]
MKNPMVSVLLSVYNGEKYLDEAIESILNQTYQDFEFIIINDGSTDKSLEIIEKYKKEDNRIVVISRENKGLIYSLNEGISQAKGKYIARMDADDISLATRFEEQV